jgi:hypothetical protein
MVFVILEDYKSVNRWADGHQKTYDTDIPYYLIVRTNSLESAYRFIGLPETSLFDSMREYGANKAKSKIPASDKERVLWDYMSKIEKYEKRDLREYKYSDSEINRIKRDVLDIVKQLPSQDIKDPYIRNYAQYYFVHQALIIYYQFAIVHRDKFDIEEITAIFTHAYKTFKVIQKTIPPEHRSLQGVSSSILFTSMLFFTLIDSSFVMTKEDACDKEARDIYEKLRQEHVLFDYKNQKSKRDRQSRAMFSNIQKLVGKEFVKTIYNDAEESYLKNCKNG